MPSRSQAPYSVPEHSAPERVIAVVLFVLAFLYLYIFRRHTSIDPDEGIILQGAQRILEGQVLYRDFFSFFTPGSYYMAAFVLRFFGDSFLAARTAVALIGAALTPLTYVFARRVCSRSTSLLVALLMTVTAVPTRFLVLHNWDSTLLASLALYSALRLIESRNVAWTFAVGSFIGLTILFEQSKGVGILVGLVAGFSLIAVLGENSSVFSRTHLAAIAAGFAWPLLLTLAYFGSRHALAAMLADWFWPIRHYSAANRVPYGYLDLGYGEFSSLFGSGPFLVRVLRLLAFSPAFWLPVLPLFGVALLISMTFTRRRRLDLGQDCVYYLLVSSGVTGLLIFAVIAVRPDRLHFFYLQPVFFIVLAWLLGGRAVRGPALVRHADFLRLAAAMLLIPMALALLVGTVGQQKKIPTRRGAVTTSGQDDVIEYTEAHVEAGERMFIYPYAPLYYFLTATRSPGKLEYFQPGMNTREQAQEMLQQLSAHPVRTVLYEPSFADQMAAWPNTPAAALARDPVADYLVREYHSCAILSSPENWRFMFMVRRGVACPPKDTVATIR
ncbi:MAG TPA: glycosyltransferase family 39 protein [Candidatus Sulfotelmatobacter sp.]|nr:glycosyltransferase family 39 protein [Candidatus Sulfotelmatobacter sp.]